MPFRSNRLQPRSWSPNLIETSRNLLKLVSPCLAPNVNCELLQRTPKVLPDEIGLRHLAGPTEDTEAFGAGCVLTRAFPIVWRMKGCSVIPIYPAYPGKDTRSMWNFCWQAFSSSSTFLVTRPALFHTPCTNTALHRCMRLHGSHGSHLSTLPDDVFLPPSVSRRCAAERSSPCGSKRPWPPKEGDRRRQRRRTKDEVGR